MEKSVPKSSHTFIRLGSASLLGVLFGVALFAPENPGSSSLPLRYVYIWLAYTCAAGFALDSDSSTSFKQVVLLSLVPAIVPLLLALYLVFFAEKRVAFSGVNSSSPRFFLLLGFVALVSLFGISLFSYARSMIVQIVVWMSGTDAETKITKITRALQALVLLVGAAFILYNKVLFSGP